MKPQRFWAVVSRDGHIDPVSVSDSRSISRAFMRYFKGRVCEVSVRVVKPKARKARKVRRCN